jgi:hypothetical protein
MNATIVQHLAFETTVTVCCPSFAGCKPFLTLTCGFSTYEFLGRASTKWDPDMKKDVFRRGPLDNWGTSPAGEPGCSSRGTTRIRADVRGFWPFWPRRPGDELPLGFPPPTLDQRIENGEFDFFFALDYADVAKDYFCGYDLGWVTRIKPPFWQDAIFLGNDELTVTWECCPGSSQSAVYASNSTKGQIEPCT